MKTTFRSDILKAIAFMVAVLSISVLFHSCCPDEPTPIPPIKPLTQSIAVAKEAVNVTRTEATLKGCVIPNQDSTEISFVYWANGIASTTKTLSGFYNGKDSVNVSIDINVSPGVKYFYQIEAKNKAGVVISSDTTKFETYAVSDADGNLYHIVTIGTQVWLKENFKGTHFANGDVIPNVTDQSQWNSMTTPAYCWYNNDPQIGNVYGGLYNFYVVNDQRGLIVGYHTPSIDEFTTLSDYLGGCSVAGGKMKEPGFTHWIQPNVGANNASEFTALPSGARKDTFGNLGDWSIFWSTTHFMGMSNVASAPDTGESSALLQLNGGTDFDRGLSVRLVKN